MTSDTKPQLSYAKRVLLAAGISVLTVLILLFIYYAFDVLLLFFAAVLLAIFLRGLADLLGRFIRIGDTWRVLLVSVLLIALLGGAIALLAPSVAEQGRNLRIELPRSAQAAAEYISEFRWGQAIIAELPSVEDIRARLDASSMLSSVGGFFSSTAGAIANFFILILLAIYLASEPAFYLRGFNRLFPINRRERVQEVLTQIGSTLHWWLIGKVGSMIFIGLLTWIGLSILGVPLALTLGLITGLLSFIPNFGPILSAIPPMLLGFIESPMTAVYVLGLYVGVQLIESNLVTPLIERNTIELPPALTILFQLALALMVGGLGLVLATPLLAVIMVVIQMIYIQDILGDREGLDDTIEEQ
jgi:predicted PurR-regulated permease PerM